jgi:hypothetical protein
MYGLKSVPFNSSPVSARAEARSLELKARLQPSAETHTPRLGPGAFNWGPVAFGLFEPRPAAFM